MKLNIFGWWTNFKISISFFIVFKVSSLLDIFTFKLIAFQATSLPSSESYAIYTVFWAPEPIFSLKW